LDGAMVAMAGITVMVLATEFFPLVTGTILMAFALAARDGSGAKGG